MAAPPKVLQLADALDMAAALVDQCVECTGAIAAETDPGLRLVLLKQYVDVVVPRTALLRERAAILRAGGAVAADALRTLSDSEGDA